MFEISIITRHDKFLIFSGCVIKKILNVLKILALVDYSCSFITLIFFILVKFYVIFGMHMSFSRCVINITVLMQ